MNKHSSKVIESNRLNHSLEPEGVSFLWSCEQDVSLCTPLHAMIMVINGGPASHNLSLIGNQPVPAYSAGGSSTPER